MASEVPLQDTHSKVSLERSLRTIKGSLHEHKIEQAKGSFESKASATLADYVSTTEATKYQVL
jgi:hypothetical protein